MNGRCDFCPRPGRLAMAMCVHEHRVGVWVCADKHAAYLDGSGDIACRLCDEADGHWCALREVTVAAR